MTRPTGRKKGRAFHAFDGRARTLRVVVRVSPGEHARLVSAAGAAGVPEYLRRVGLDAATATEPTLYMSEAVRADLRAAMRSDAPVFRLDSTTGAWTVADGWTAAETEPGMFTVQRDGEPVAVVRGPGVRLDIGMTAPRRRVDFTFDDFTAAVESLDRKKTSPPALIISESRCAGDADYRPATAEERAAEPGLHGFAFGVLGAPVPVYEPALAGTEPKERKP